MVADIECPVFRSPMFYGKYEPSIGSESCKGHHDVVVENANLSNGSVILK